MGAPSRLCPIAARRSDVPCPSRIDETCVYLLDTNVISELRRARPHGAVVAWLRSVDDASLHLSAVTVGEVQAGIEKTQESDPDKAAEIERWLQLIEDTHRVLPMDGRTFRQWARLMHRTSNTSYEDAMIAATAQVHGLLVMTRNVSDFAALGVESRNPFEYGGVDNF